VYDKQAKGAYPNVRALHGNAWLLFGSLFSPSSLTWIVLNFLDLWWKLKHQKRRIVSDAFARLRAALPIDERGVVVQGTFGGKPRAVPLAGNALAAHFGKRARKGRLIEARLKDVLGLAWPEAR